MNFVIMVKEVDDQTNDVTKVEYNTHKKKLNQTL